MTTDHLVVLVTVADVDTGRTIGRALVEERLAACVQIIPGGSAIYRWQGQLFDEPQTQLLVKTAAAAWDRLRQRVVELHPDEVPEILALPVLDGLPAYLGWMDEQ